MATLSSAASPFCRPEENPFLLLESCGKAIEGIFRGHAGRPLRRTWIDRPYGEEEISRLEEEVLPVIQQCMARVDEIDRALEAEAELSYRQVVEAEALQRRGEHSMAMRWVPAAECSRGAVMPAALEPLPA
jgi:hypothetical protein